MNLICNIILVISAIAIIIYDYKIKKIPMWLLIINYISICLLLNKWLLFGIVFILLAKLKDFPIDLLYVLIMCYLIIIVNNYFSLLGIMILLLHILISKEEKISFMVSLEIAIVLEILIKEMVV
jgi:hypothetical protein